MAIRCLPGLLHARHVDAVPGQIVARRIAVLLHGHDIARLRDRGPGGGDAHTRMPGHKRDPMRGSTGIARAARAGRDVKRSFSHAPLCFMAARVTAGASVPAGSRRHLGLGIQRLLRFALLRRRLLPPRLIAALDHDAFRFRQPWSSRDQVMVLGPVAARLSGGDKLGHRGRGRPEQLVVGREGQERPFSPDVWGARRPPASTTSTSPSTSSRLTGAGRVQRRAARGGAVHKSEGTDPSPPRGGRGTPEADELASAPHAPPSRAARPRGRGGLADAPSAPTRRPATRRR